MALRTPHLKFQNQTNFKHDVRKFIEHLGQETFLLSFLQGQWFLLFLMFLATFHRRSLTASANRIIRWYLSVWRLTRNLNVFEFFFFNYFTILSYSSSVFEIWSFNIRCLLVKIISVNYSSKIVLIIVVSINSNFSK